MLIGTYLSPQTRCQEEDRVSSMTKAIGLQPVSTQLRKCPNGAAKLASFCASLDQIGFVLGAIGPNWLRSKGWQTKLALFCTTLERIGFVLCGEMANWLRSGSRSGLGSFGIQWGSPSIQGKINRRWREPIWRAVGQQLAQATCWITRPEIVYEISRKSGLKSSMVGQLSE